MSRSRSKLVERVVAAPRTRRAQPAHLFGIEQEFEVYRDSQHVDFNRFIHEAVEASGQAVCPAGSAGYYLRSGTLLISDGWEAEVATPPQLVKPGLFQEIPVLTRGIQMELLEHLRALEACAGPRLTLTGYSTHLSAWCSGVHPMAICRVYARTMAPAMMLFLDVGSSPGLLVRPRPRRFEVGGDYVQPNDDICVASLFFVASFLAVVDAVVGRNVVRLPVHLDTSRIEPTCQRRGFYVDRMAFGEDLYDLGRSACLTLEAGGTIDAQTAVQRIWQYVRPYAEALGSPAELDLLTRTVAGVRRFPSESRGENHAEIAPISKTPATQKLPMHPFTAGLVTRQVGARTFTPEVVTWDYIVYRLEGEGKARYLNVPLDSLPEWVNATESGGGEAWLKSIAKLSSSPVLASEADADTAGLFTDIDSVALSQRFEGRKKKKKKKPEEPLCDVVIDDEGNVEICMPEVVDSQVSLVEQEPPQGDRRIANGVWIHNGTFTNEHVDHRVRSRGLDFEFVRYYRSGISYSGPLGLNWDHVYNARLVAHPPPAARRIPGGWCEPFSAATTAGPVTYHHGTGRVTEHAFASWEVRTVSWCGAAPFTAIVTTYKQNDGEPFEIQRYAVLAGTPPDPIDDPIFFRVMHRGGTRFLLNCYGRLMEVRHRNHDTTRCRYGLPLDPGTNYFVLRKVIDSQGREYALDYQMLGGAPRIVKLTDPWAREVSFEYDADLQLEKVKLARGDAGIPEILYRYGGGQRGGLLREIVNPLEAAGNQQSWLENTYDARERISRQRVGSSAAQPPAGGNYRITYPSLLRVNLTDRVGVRTGFVLKQLGAAKVVETESLRDQIGTGGTITSTQLTTRYEYDRHFHVKRVVYPSGREEVFRFRNRNAMVRLGDEFDDVQRRITHHNDLGRDALQVYQRVAQGGGAAALHW